MDMSVNHLLSKAKTVFFWLILILLPVLIAIGIQFTHIILPSITIEQRYHRQHDYNCLRLDVAVWPPCAKISKIARFFCC